MLILVLLGMYFDAAVVFVTSQTILFKLAPAILWFWILISFRYMYLVRDITQGLLNEISTLIYQTTNLVFPNFFHEIFSVEQLKNKTKNFSWVQNRFFLRFGPMKSLFSTEKILWNKLGKTRFLVWWFDVTNWLYSFGWDLFGKNQEKTDTNHSMVNSSLFPTSMYLLWHF